MENQKIFLNAKWIIGCKILQSLIQLIVGMLMARYLGPSKYGRVNYAASVVAFFAPVMQLGLQFTLVQEYVDRPDKEGEILGTALAMNLLSALACCTGVIAFAMAANAGETVTIFVCALYSTSMIFQGTEMMQYWFQAKLLSKYSSLSILCAYIAASAYKIYLLAAGKSVYWFALSYTVEYGAASALLFAAYARQGTQKIKVSIPLAKQLFAKSRHYIAAMLMNVVYVRTGNVLLTLFIGEAENGLYAAALTSTCIIDFVFMAIIDTARPVVLESKKQSCEDFKKNVSRTYAMTTWLALAQSVIFTLFAGLIIRILYGEAYMLAVPALRILVWSSAFSYMGYVRNIWILAEEKHKFLFWINASGAVASLLFNICLIPQWGVLGAALATVFTQVFTNFIMGFVLKEVRPNNALLLAGFNPRLILEMIPMLKKR